MSVNHIAFSRNTPNGAQFSQSLKKFFDGVDELNEHLQTMIQMEDGAASGTDVFTYIKTKFGFDSDQKAEDAVNELGSLMSKLNTTGGATADHVQDAIIQARARFS